jgi:Tfp pilus assembly protein PilF
MHRSDVQSPIGVAVQNPTALKTNQNRIWWLLALLLLIVNLLAWQRLRLADWLCEMVTMQSDQSDYTQQRLWLDRIERVSPHSAQLALHRARLARFEGDFEKARAELRRARYLGGDPQLADREEWLLLAQSGRIAVAEPELARLLEEGSGEVPEICLAYATGYIRVRNFPAALTLLRGMLQDYPGDARAHAWSGQVYAEIKDVDNAEKSFRTALQLEPENALAALGLGQLLVDSKEFEAAVPYFQTAMQVAQYAPAAASGLAVCWQSLSQPEKAEAILVEALSRFPNDYRLLVEFANLLNERGDFDKAIELLQPEIDHGTLRREIRYAYAIALRSKGRIEEATGHFEYAAEAARMIVDAKAKAPLAADDPRNAELRSAIGAQHLQYGNEEEGLIWLHSALEQQPSLQSAHRSLARHYLAKSQREAKYLGIAQRHLALAGPEFRTSGTPASRTEAPAAAPVSPLP